MAKTINVMAPLVVGDPEGQDSEASRQSWVQFEKEIASAKRMGAHAVTTDVWWGLVEKQAKQFDFSLYDKIADCIQKHGLDWVPIFSTHQCGGNVGDTVNIAFPEHIFLKAAQKLGSNDSNAVKYLSEQGNVCSEVVSVHATYLILDDLRAFYAAFRDHYTARAKIIPELNFSLGPAGELRYPSYNSQDKNTGYGFDGALQCYSDLAKKSWYDFVLARHRSLDGVRKAWGPFENIEPPRDTAAFYAHGDHINTEYGRDLFDWHQDSLFEHARMVLTVAADVFWIPNGPFENVDLGFKVPGVHWLMGHWEGSQLVLSSRLPELNAGMLRTRDWNDSSDASHGYHHLLRFASELELSLRARHSTINGGSTTTKSSARLVVHFTCLEMADGEHESLAYQLVRWVAEEARRQGVVVKGENALNYTLYDPESWNRIRSAMALYEGLTILRLSDVVENEVATREFAATCRDLATRNGRPSQLNTNVIPFQQSWDRLRKSIAAGKKSK